MLSSELENPVLVLGGNLTGLKIAREFGKYGLDVYLVTDKESDIALKSKHWKERIIVHRPWNCELLKRLLRRMAKTTTKRLVIYPVTDLDALNLSKIKDELQDDYYFVVGERDATEMLVIKSKFYRALSKTSIEFPATFFPEDLASAKRIGKDLSYPVFIRPSITQSFTKVFGVNKGFIAKSHMELLNYYRLATSKNVEVMFQEIISGPPYNSIQLEGYFNKEFCSTGLFARQRLRIWPPDFGNTTLCVSVKISNFSFEGKQMSDFLKTLCYNGLASAEYKKDLRDGRNKLLEINARPWLHFWLSAECGNNILLSSYLDAIGQETEYTKGGVAGIKSIHLDNDIVAGVKMFQEGKLGILEWFSSLKGVRQSALLDKTDLVPSFDNYFKKFIRFCFNRANALSPISERKDIEKMCPECKKELPEIDFIFCPRCGSTIPLEETIVASSHLEKRKKGNHAEEKLTAKRH